MTFIPKNWEDLPAKNTPIDRESLQDLETRLANYGGEQQALNVKSYGAKGDGTQLLDGEMTLGGKELKTAHSFATADIGKEITVEGAGPGSKLPLVTTIESVSSGTATLTNAAEKAVSGKIVLFGTDDTSAIQSALNAAHELYLSTGSPQTLWFPSLSFLMSYAKVLEGVEVCLELKSGTIMQADGAHLFTMPPAATVTTKAYEGEVTELKVASTRRFSETNKVVNATDLQGELGFSWTSKTATSFAGTGGEIGGKYPIGTIIGQTHNRAMISTPASEMASEWKIKGFVLDGQASGEGTETAFPEDGQHGIFVFYGGENFEIAFNEAKGFAGKVFFIHGEDEPGRLAAFSVHHNYIHDGFGNAMRYSLPVDFSITDNIIRNVRRENNATAEAMITTASLETRGGLIADNVIDNWGTMDVSGSGMIIQGNYLRAGVKRPGNALLAIGVSNHTVVADNILDLGPALSSTLGLWLTGVEGGNKNLTISGNIFQGATGGSTGTDLLLTTASVENLSLVGNTFSTPFAASVRIVTAEAKTNVVVADNIFDFKAANCALIVRAGKHLSITDNILNGGKLEIEEGEDAIVSGNVVNAFENKGTAIFCEGSSSVVAENNLKGTGAVIQLSSAIAYDNMINGVSEAVTVPYIEKLVAGLGGESAYKTAVLADAPVAYWRMDETAGAKDQTANKNEGVLHGSVPVAAGALGKSADFDKANSYTNNVANYFSVVDSASLHLTAALSVECWIYFTALTGNCGIFEKSIGGSADTSYVLVTVGSSLLARVVKGSVLYTATFEPLIKETYYHAVMTFESGSLKLFLNTEKVAEKAVPAGVIDTGVGESVIGIRSNIALPMNGRIDELAIYKTALSEARIKAHYKAGTE